jgi:hypothetical protein
VPFNLTPDYGGPTERKFYRLEGPPHFCGRLRRHVAYRMEDRPISLIVTWPRWPPGGRPTVSFRLVFHQQAVQSG